MRIDPETLLFEDLTAAEAKELQGALENIVFKGDPLVADWLEEWLAVAPEAGRLLLITTVLPGRIGISLLRRRNPKPVPSIQMAFPKGANVRFTEDMAYGWHYNRAGCRVTTSSDPTELRPVIVEDPARTNCYSGGQYWTGWTIPKGTIGTVEKAGICDPKPTPFVYVELVSGKTILVRDPFHMLKVVGALGVVCSEGAS